MKKISLLVCILSFVASPFIYSKTYNDSIAPGANYNKALFRLWHSDDAKNIRGILVLMTGSNGDGRNMADDALWQQFAQRNGFALLACFYNDAQHKNQ